MDVWENRIGQNISTVDPLEDMDSLIYNIFNDKKYSNCQYFK